MKEKTFTKSEVETILVDAFERDLPDYQDPKYDIVWQIVHNVIDTLEILEDE